jgi:pyruvate dehydrogenase E2 component (dihydrolipoamide acetyltransferase)
MIEFKLPSLGADMDEGKLVEWKVKPGDRVKRGDLIAVVETPKAAVDVEVWQDGVVHELVTKPGEKIPVGTVMARLLAPGESAPPRLAVPAAAAAVPAVRPAGMPAAPGPTLVPSAPPPAGAAGPSLVPSTPPPAGAAGPSLVPSTPPPAGMRHPASPAARKHARELGVDIDKVAGTGPHGAVTVEDVEKAAKGAPSAAPLAAAPAAPSAAEAAAARAAEMRKAIAAAMSRSKREIPHYYLSESVPLERATAWLEAENARRPITERLLMAVLYLKAVALACKAFPDMNGHYVNQAFRPSAAVHVGVAISLRQGGLIAPAIHAVETLPLADLMKKLSDLVRRARAGSLRSSEMSDPTITVTNLGEGGVESVHAVIYPPQVAIVGFGRIAPRPWAVDGAMKVEPLVVASLAADHRVSDGHRGALFLADVARRLQEPEKL